MHFIIIAPLNQLCNYVLNSNAKIKPQSFSGGGAAALRNKVMSYTASDDRVAARLLPESNSCSWPLSLLPVVNGVDPVSSVTTSTVPRSL